MAAMALRNQRSGPASPPGLSEKQRTRIIDDYLQIDGWRIVKTEALSLLNPIHGAGESGIPDRLYLRYGDGMLGEILWIEHKKPKGRTRLKQAEWHKLERAKGAIVAVALIDFEPSYEGFVRWYEEMGLRRKVLPFDEQ